jgi:N-acetylglucosamine kinase-like BadF-type ATPase
MDEKRCYLAVDGGNSKTEYRLLNASGAVIAASRGGASNHETLPGGFDGAADVLICEIADLLEAQGCSLSHVADAVLGLAGADYDEEAIALQAALHARGLQRCFVCNDGYLGVMAGIETGVGICYSAGSGVTCAGMNAEGARAQFGGIGVLSGDTGGGFDIAAFVYRSVYQHLFFGKAYTTLKDAYFTLFDVRTPESFLASAARIQNEESARQLIGLFFTAMETGDELALRYAALAASHAADCVVAVSDALHLKPTVHVALSGSIMTAVAPPTFRRMIEYELFRRKGKYFSLRVNDRQPVDGAVRWVRMRNHLSETLT